MQVGETRKIGCERLKVNTIDARVFFEPPDEEMRYLPEGPYRLQKDHVSWVAIQHGPDRKVGSLNILDLASKSNKSFSLPGRPGFAFPTSNPNVFVLGVERSVVLFDLLKGTCEAIASDIDAEVEGTIINDGLVHEDVIVFGCKDLKFAEQKAGLYLMRADRSLVCLADNQVCSNGKAIRQEDDNSLLLFDICSCSKQVTEWQFDLDRGTISDWRTVIDLKDEEVFPDGMILTPDQQSLIVAIFNPGDTSVGEARQYAIATGELENTWRCQGSARVTCPQLIELDGQIKLLLTTADEGMPPELRKKNPNAGCLFIGETDFKQLNANPVYPL